MSSSDTVAKGWRSIAANALVATTSEVITLSKAPQGIMSVWILSDVDIHINQGAVAAVTDFKIIADTYWEIAVQDLISFSVFPTANGTLWLMEYTD